MKDKLALADAVISDFQQTGICEIVIGEVVKRWNHLWKIYQWRDEFTLVKFIRKDSEIRALKVAISDQQARELIDKLNLNQYSNGIFKSSSVWK